MIGPMTITARYPAACACCPVPIRVGDQIEWVKGRPAVHARCAGKAGAPIAKPADAPRKAPAGKRTGCSCGSRVDAFGDLIPSRSDCWTCRHDA